MLSELRAIYLGALVYLLKRLGGGVEVSHYARVSRRLPGRREHVMEFLIEGRDRIKIVRPGAFLWLADFDPR